MYNASGTECVFMADFTSGRMLGSMWSAANVVPILGRRRANRLLRHNEAPRIMLAPPFCGTHPPNPARTCVCTARSAAAAAMATVEASMASAINGRVRSRTLRRCVQG